MTATPPPDAPPDMRSSRPGTPLWVLVAFVVATLVVFHRALSPDLAILERDMFRVYLPAKLLWRQQVLAGEFPGWNPFDGLGQPLAGGMVTGAYHPSNLLFLLLEPLSALKLAVLSCFPLAGLGAWLSMRARGASTLAAAVAAVGFAFGGYLVSMTNNLAYLLATATLPWVLWAAERTLQEGTARWAAATGALLALIPLAGDPQAYAVTAATLLALALLRPRDARARTRALGLQALAVLISALLSSFQLVAAWSALRDSATILFTADFAQQWSTHPLRILDLAFGDVLAKRGAFDDVVATSLLGLGMDSFWARSLYLGLPSLALAACALFTRGRERAVWASAGLAVLFLALALGKYTPVYGLVYKLLPLWRPFRYPEKLIPHFAYWTLALTAVGMDAVHEGTPRRRRQLGLGLLVLSTASLALALGAHRVVGTLLPLLTGAVERWPELAQTLAARLTQAALVTGLACAVAGGAWCVLRSRRALGLVSLAAVALPTLWVAEGVYLSEPRDVADLKPGLVDAVERELGEPPLGRARVYNAVSHLRAIEAGLSYETRTLATVANAILPDTGAPWGIESANWYLPAVPRRVGALILDRAGWGRRYARLANVRYVVVDNQDAFDTHPPPNLLVRQFAFGQALVHNPNALPRAYLAAPRCVAGPAESLARIAAPDFPLGKEAVVECREPLPAGPPGGVEGSVRLARYAANEVALDVEARDSGVLVLSDPLADGWTATVDGTPADILPANHAFRGVAVASGTHRVVFRYRPPLLGLALALTALGAAMCAVAWAGRLRRHVPAP